MSKKTIFVIDDDEIFSSCIEKTIKSVETSLEVKKFKNAVEAISELSEPLPSLIFLDVLLPGPDGFTFLNEIASYVDTGRIPVVIVTSLDLPDFDLQLYGVVGILKKEQMLPEEIKSYVKRYSY